MDHRPHQASDKNGGAHFYIRTFGPKLVGNKVVPNDKETLDDELKKYAEEEPVQAVCGGVGPFHIFKGDRTGLVFGADTLHILGSKRDIFSNLLADDARYREALDSKGDKRLHLIASAVKEVLEKSTPAERTKILTDINLSRTQFPHVYELALKPVRISMDIVRLRAKYHEMNLRHKGILPDISSKYLVVDLLERKISDLRPENIQPLSVYKDVLLKMSDDYKDEVCSLKRDKASPDGHPADAIGNDDFERRLTLVNAISAIELAVAKLGEMNSTEEEFASARQALTKEIEFSNAVIAIEGVLAKLPGMTASEDTNYLRKGFDRKSSPVRYASKKFFPHNENLLIVKNKDLTGIYVPMEAPELALDLYDDCKKRGMTLPFKGYRLLNDMHVYDISPDEVHLMVEAKHIQYRVQKQAAHDLTAHLSTLEKDGVLTAQRLNQFILEAHKVFDMEFEGGARRAAVPSDSSVKRLIGDRIKGKIEKTLIEVAERG